MERKQKITKAVFRWLVLSGALGWWGLWAMCFLDDDCCCYDLANTDDADGSAFACAVCCLETHTRLARRNHCAYQFCHAA